MLAASAILGLLPQPVPAANETTAPPPIRLRLEWGGETARAWSGLLEISRGRLERPVSLGVAADDPGTIRTDDGAVWIERRTPRLHDGCDVDVSAPPDAVLSVALQTPGHPEAGARLDVKLSELLDGDKTVPLDSRRGRLVVRRAPGDAIRLAIDRPHLVFSSGETFAAVAWLSLPDPKRMNRDDAGLRWELAVARGGETLATGTIPLEIPRADGDPGATFAVPLSVPLPRDEGVYDIRLTAPGGPGAPAARGVQVIVLNTSGPQPPVAPRDEQVVDAFAPFDDDDGRRVQQRHSLRLASESSDRSPQWLPVHEPAPAGGPGVRPAEADDPRGWRSYRLRIARPGAPHRLTVSFPHGAAQDVGISLLEPNAAGRLMPIGLDSALSIPAPADSPPAESTAGAEPQSSPKHEILFWPRIADPIVLLYSLSGNEPVRAERIEVRTASLNRRLADRTDAPAAKRRLVGAYMHKPLLPENFGATEVLDRASGRSLDDWVTFHDAAERLAACLHDAGHNSLLLGVLADGGTIHPSRLLQPTHRYDTGTQFSNGQDPLRKDVLELLFRVFEREGLALIPELQFSTPLPALEQALAAGGAGAAGIELIGRDGRTWREARATDRGLAPYYNPLDPAVQQAVFDVVDEILERYRGRAAFRGLAIESSSAGWMQFPGLDWGYDDRTIARFENDTSIRVPSGEGAARFPVRHAFLTHTARPEWTRWRCARLAEFHRRIAQRVAQAIPDGQYFLAGNRVLQGGNPDDDLAEALVTGAKLHELLACKGLDFSLYRDVERLTVLRPVVRTGSCAADRRALDRSINDSPEYDAAFAGCVTGSLFHHLPHERRLAEFDEVSPWQPAFTWFAAHETPIGADNRRRFAHALAAYDARAFFDGGWMVPLGQQGPLRETLAALRRLPAVSFHELAGTQSQPAVVRFARQSQQTYFYVANDSPWRIEVSVELTTREGAAFRSLKDDSRLPVAADGTATGTAVVTVQAWDLEAFVADDPAARVDDIGVAVSPPGLATLQQRLQEFDARLAAAHRRSPPLRGVQRFGPNDLRQLTKTFSAAMLAWEERRYSDCHRLLESYWGRFLFFHPPQDPPAPTSTAAQP